MTKISRFYGAPRTCIQGYTTGLSGLASPDATIAGIRQFITGAGTSWPIGLGGLPGGIVGFSSAPHVSLLTLLWTIKKFRIVGQVHCINKAIAFPEGHPELTVEWITGIGLVDIDEEVAWGAPRNVGQQSVQRGLEFEGGYMQLGGWMQSVNARQLFPWLRYTAVITGDSVPVAYPEFTATPTYGFNCGTFIGKPGGGGDGFAENPETGFIDVVFPDQLARARVIGHEQAPPTFPAWIPVDPPGSPGLTEIGTVNIKGLGSAPIIGDNLEGQYLIDEFRTDAEMNIIPLSDRWTD